jgi:hypothetical protein
MPQKHKKSDPLRQEDSVEVFVVVIVSIKNEKSQVKIKDLHK